jgi:hypothetical protein
MGDAGSFLALGPKVHVMFMSPPWASDRGSGFDPERFADSVAAAGITLVEFYCKDHNGVCYYPADGAPPFERDLVAELVTALHARDIKLVAYVSAGYDAHALAQHPDWRIVDRDGRPRVLAPPLAMACARSAYRPFLLRQVEQLVGPYPIDGLWVDILPLAWPSQMTDSHRETPGAETDFFMVHDMPLPCYCPACRAQFRDERGRPLPVEPAGDELRELFDFEVEGVRRLLSDLRDILRRHHPDAPFTYNGAGSPGDPLDLGDLVSIESHAPEYPLSSFVARWARGRGRASETLTPGGLEGWFTPQPKPVSLIRLEAAIPLAQGRSAVSGVPVAADGGVDLARVAETGAAYPVAGALRDSLRSPESVAEVLIASTVDPARAPEHWGPMTRSLLSWHRALMARHVQYDIAPLADDLSAYRVVILPGQLAMSDADAERVRRYVDGGGSLVCTDDTSLHDEQGRRRDELALGDVLGVRLLGRLGSRLGYVRLLDAGLVSAVTDAWMLVKREPLRVDVPGRDVQAVAAAPDLGPIDPVDVGWAYPSADETTALPFIVSGPFGNGVATYVAGSLDDPPRVVGGPDREMEAAWVRQLCGALVVRRLPDPVLTTDAPSSVEVVLNRHPWGLAVHLIDHAVGSPAWLVPEPPILRDVTVRLDQARLGSLTEARSADGRALETRTEGSILVIRIPELSVHGLVTIR